MHLLKFSVRTTIPLLPSPRIRGVCLNRAKRPSFSSFNRIVPRLYKNAHPGLCDIEDMYHRAETDFELMAMSARQANAFGSVGRWVTPWC